MSEEFVSRRLRASMFMAIVTALSLFAAAPAAAADFSVVIPAADNPCGVDVLLEADFLPTDHPRMGYGDITFTNLETGTTFLQHSRHLDSWTFDPSTETWHGRIHGRIWTPIYPGEPGPIGVVQEPGLWIVTRGTLEYTLDQNDVLSDFSLNGRYTDVCAELTA